MLIRFVAGVFAVVLVPLVLSTTGRAQSPGPLATAPLQSGESIRVVGCVVRDADYALATGSAPSAGNKTASAAQLVLTAGDATEQAYSLTGTNESAVARYLGRRVEITGSVEQVRVAAPPTTDGSPAAAAEAGRRVAGGLPPSGANGVTPAGSPAHEPGDAVSGTVSTTGSASGGVAAPRPARAAPDALPRINVTSFRAVEGECDDLRASGTPARSTDSSASQTEAPAARAPLTTPPRAEEQRVTATGCLVRQTPAGGALSAQEVTAHDEFVLTRAALAPTRSPNVLGAVPGSAPSGSGSGTVPPSASAAQNEPDVAERSFALTSRGSEERAALAKYVGQRIELVGTVDDGNAGGAGRTDSAARRTGEAAAGTSGRVEAPAAVAHPSAPAQRITVASFRPIGGSCQ